jgi:hypothetical protein
MAAQAAKSRVTDEQRERCKKQFYSLHLPEKFDSARQILEQYSGIPADEVLILTSVLTYLLRIIRHSSREVVYSCLLHCPYIRFPGALCLVGIGVFGLQL